MAFLIQTGLVFKRDIGKVFAIKVRFLAIVIDKPSLQKQKWRCRNSNRHKGNPNLDRILTSRIRILKNF